MAKNSARLKHQERVLARKVRRAHKKGSGLKSATRQYLNSYSAKTIAVSQAAKALRTKLSSDQLAKLAKSLDPWKSCDEPVELSPMAKPNDPHDFRFILRFGVQNRARQILVRNLLRARWGIAAQQHLFQGGRDEAVKQVQSGYQEGLQFVFELDVYRCFRSFDRKGIAKFLNLPERVVAGVLSGGELNVILSKEYEGVIAYGPDDLPDSPIEVFGMMEDDWGSARLGLTEGSMVSPYAAELLLAWVLENVPDGAWRIVNYADNFLCLCESESAANELRDILRELLHKHPAGPLKAKQFPKIFAPEEAFTFLGYYLVPRPTIGLAPIWSERANAKAREIRRSAYKKLCSPTLSYANKKSKLKLVVRKHKAIVNGYPLWKEGKAFHEFKMAKLEGEVLGH
jgi:hypothetical protein